MVQELPEFEVRRIPAHQTHALRHGVLRPHQRLEDMVYDGDELPTTMHLGAFAENEPGSMPVGIVTLSVATMPGSPMAGDWRLRGMAVAPAVQASGVGRRLVVFGIGIVREAGGRRLWCNARVAAMGFYDKLGFTSHGDEFDIPGIGGHYVMSIDIR